MTTTNELMASELILYMHKELAVLAVLCYFGTVQHRDKTMSALYEVEYLKSKQDHLDTLGDQPELQRQLKDNLRKEGFLGL